MQARGQGFTAKANVGYNHEWERGLQGMHCILCDCSYAGYALHTMQVCTAYYASMQWCNVK